MKFTKLTLALVILFFCKESYAQGTWTPLSNLAPHFNSGVMLVLPDGTIMCKTSSGGGNGTVWDKLTPNASGSYQNGTWSSLGAMNNDRLYFSSQVLNDGRVYVAGGEYGTGGSKSEVYNPQTNTWTMAPVLPNEYISDANSEILADGRVVQVTVVDTVGGTPFLSRKTYLYDPATNTYSSGPNTFGSSNESAWVKLPDGSILFVDRLSTNAERYMPATNTWIHDASVPVGLYDPYGDETGAGFLLPNGKVIFIGSTSVTAIYTPSGSVANGSWAAGPAIPGGQGAPDAAAAMMVNGKIICAVSPTPYASNHFPDSTYFYEYDYVSNSFTLINNMFGSTLDAGDPCFITNMVCLPDGNILFAFQGDRRYYIYSPGSAALSAGQPTVSNVLRVNCDTFTATGTLFHGISEGASYGDDWQMSSNYPIVRLTSGSNVYYARTYNWNHNGAVMTGAALDTVKFILPAGVPAGSYSLQVVANGNPSNNFAFNYDLNISPSTTSICPTATTTFTDTWPGGTWSSSNTGVATVGSSTGVVTGVAGGSAIITYTISAGCFSIATVNVNTGASAISGPSVVCALATITLTDVTGGGTWSSSNTGAATVGSGSGVVTGVGSGTATISYSVGGCSAATQDITVNAAPSAIAGTNRVCVGATTSLSDGGGGTWTSSNTAQATVGSSTGVVTGVGTGTPDITYTLPVTGCFITAPVTVNPAPSAITGTTTLCISSATTLSDGGGGTWSSTNTTVATVGSSTGVVNGLTTGADTIIYTLPTGCFATATVNVISVASPISGPLQVCELAMITLTDAGGGTWASSTTGVATVGSGSGVVTGVVSGTSTITYNLSGCTATAIVTVDAVPTAITGITMVCIGATTTLSDGGGGTWSSSNTGQATVDALGVVTGAATGTPNITYTLPVTNCFTTTPVTVNPLPSAISGMTSVCTGSSTTLSDAGGGTWSSSNTTVATVGSGTGVVNGLTSGIDTITYTLGTGCTAMATVTVNLPPPAITGAGEVCPGSFITLSDATGGGTWSSSNTAQATVGSSSGIVTGVTSGIPNITYSLGGTCIATAPVTVNLQPGVITGTAMVCMNAMTTLSDGGGGTWASGDVSVATVVTGTGDVTGVSAGTASITYSLPSGCTRAIVVTVNPLPSAISGPSVVCVGSSIALSDAGGGTWNSSNTLLATVGIATGVVYGVSSGTPEITYTLPVTGCKTATVVTVSPLPAVISGTMRVCIGAITTLSDTGGGTWSSSNIARATVDITTGDVTGVTAGTLTVTYALPGGCTKTTLVTVNPFPAAISGSTGLCIGTTITLTDATAGGAWSSSDAATATVSATTGIVYAVASGLVTISYTSAAGCIATATVTVSVSPTAISGPSMVCQGSSITLTDGTPGGVWGGTGAFVTVGSTTGVVTGIHPGAAIITYSIGGCTMSKSVTVSPISPIAGVAATCVGATTTLYDGTGGGDWSSSNTAIATTIAIGFGVGYVGGESGGVPTITYTMPSGCFVTIPVTINTAPAPITGTASVCVGLTTNLTDTVSGGVWSSTATARATVDSTGIVTGVFAGTSTIIYSLGVGCNAIKVVTVYPTPVAIAGISTICAGATTTLTDATAGGVWSSSDAAMATVGATTGIVYAVSSGVVTISYTIGAGCIATKIITVSVSPAAISGPSMVCRGDSITLTNLTPGGIWIGTGASVTVGSTTGVVTGIRPGVATITYTIGGCMMSKSVTVSAISPITGIASACPGTTTTLYDATGGGDWSSSNTAIATTVGIGFGVGYVVGVSGGVSIITYTMPSGCFVTIPVTINTAPAAITGAAGVCVGLTTTLTDAVSGGVWSSTALARATVDSTGIVTGVSAGTTTIIYSLGMGCNATKVVTVYPTPGPIAGISTICAGATTPLTDATAGGVWSSSDAATATIGTTTGIVYAVSPGVVTISYALGAGCIATKIITVSLSPAAVSGPSFVCLGSPIILSDAVPGGVWSSTSSFVTVGSTTGVVTGIHPGAAIITYSTGGCTVSTSVTVNPISPITGIAGTCVGATTTLYDATGGGDWSSSNTAMATTIAIGFGVGYVGGVSGGVPTITYTMPSGCFVTIPVTINTAPAPITGIAGVCMGLTTTLSNAVSGGVWSSTATARATIDSTGIVTGVSAGTTTIIYSLGTGCNAAKVVTVYASPAAIAGMSTICEGATTPLRDATIGGAWRSSDIGVAAVSAAGIAGGVSAGTATITYALAGGCIATKPVTVNSAPTAISGPGGVCAGSSITLTNGTGGGSWSSTSLAVSVGAGTGVIAGLSAGVATITYSIGTCIATKSVTISAMSPITGITNICIGSTITLIDGTGGGAWSTSAPGVATVTTIGSGVGSVRGLSAGTANIYYTLPSGCSAAVVVTVNSPAAIMGAPVVCQGQTITLTDTAAGGSWSSSALGIATIDGAGMVTGVIAGTAAISYSIGTCAATIIITVRPLPAAISGASFVCTGGSAILSDITAGGGWSSSDGAVATVDGGGVVSGVSSGFATITYTAGTGCYVTLAIVDNDPPTGITGTMVLCVGSVTTLADAVSGGNWSSSAGSIATVDSSGNVSGVSAGSVNITYSTGAGCFAVAGVTVDPLPTAITGPSSVCSGGSITLSDSTAGGSWSSSGPAVASVDGAGVVYGITSGSVTITYQVGTGCYITTVITVNAPPTGILGASEVCEGMMITLADSITGGGWSSSDILIATIDGTGAVTGVAAGSVNITYTLLSGCYSSWPITVNASPAPVIGGTGVCTGSAISLSDATVGGSWSTSVSGIADIDAFGTVTGISSGTETVTYMLTTGCYATSPMADNDLPAAITGATILCAGGTTSLSDSTPGGGWISSDITIASVDAVTGVVSGVSAGTANIYYALGTGCAVGVGVAVYTAPSPITGPSGICLGSTSAYSDSVGGGTWSVSNTAIATIDASTGVAYGVSSGTVIISYDPGTGCVATKSVIVNFSAAPIAGPSNVCRGSSVTLTDASGGGVWSSTSSFISVGSSTGVITGINPGAAVINYTVGSCSATRSITVSPISPITGTTSACVGTVVTLSDGTGGGDWTSTSPAIATTLAIGSGVAYVGGVSAGTAAITYLMPSGCYATAVVTINPVPSAIAGTSRVCTGQITTLSDSLSGGSWSSSNTAIATAGSATGDIYGVGAGVATITYMFSTGCRATRPVTVSLSPTAISGASGICNGTTTALTDGTGGGRWSSSNTAVATAGSTTGIIYSVSPGIVTITYTLTSGCSVSKAITVNPAPTAITGATNVCVASMATLADAVSGGVWYSASAFVSVGSATGIITGITAGSATVTYSIGSCTVTRSIVVSPIAPITGTLSVCAGATTTLSDGITGGGWSSSTSAVATVVAIGAGRGSVTGVSAGTANIYYVLPTGCAAAVTVTVNPVPAPIAGATGLCAHATTALTDITAGGVWSSNNLAVATIGSLSGIVSGITSGSTVISYTLSTGCKVMRIESVSMCGRPVSAVQQVCVGAAIALTQDMPGGAWSSSDNSIAKVDAVSGVVTGLAAGNAAIKYTVANGADESTEIVPVVVVPVPHAATISVDPGTNILPGQNVTLTANGVGAGNDAKYQWLINDVPVLGAVSQVFTSTSFANNDVVSCSVLSNSVCNAVMSDKVRITVVNAGGIIHSGTGALVNVIPNPNKGAFTIKGTLGTANDEDVTLEVTDILGQVVYKNNTVAHSGMLDEKVVLRSNIANGMYVLNIRSGSASMIFHIVIEQ